MASAWPKRKRWYWSFKLKTGKRFVDVIPNRPDGKPITRSYAKKYADTWEARYIAGLWDPNAPPPMAEANASITLAEYGAEWAKLITNANASGDARWFHSFIRPMMGTMRLCDVKPKHVRQFVDTLKHTKSRKKLKSGDAGLIAPRTIRNIYSVLSRIFSRAVEDEILSANPCRQLRGVVPVIADKDPMARAKWVRTPDEVVALLTDTRIPADRRVLYALEFLMGARFSEIAVLRWRHWDRDVVPLGRLTVAYSRDLKTGLEKSTKTGVPRPVPVHPTLAQILKDWWGAGWCNHYGRAPTEDDYIVPTYNLTARDVRNNWTRHKEDCDRIGIRMTRQHDARRTFISLSLAGGARKDILQWITHPSPNQRTIDLYTTLPWESLCEAVQCLRLTLQPPPSDPSRATLVLPAAEGEL